MQKLVFIIIFFIISVNVFGHSDGYKIKVNKMNFIRIAFADERTPDYLTRSDGLFLDFLLWIAHNKHFLKNVDKDLFIEIVYMADRKYVFFYENNIDKKLFYYTTDIELKNNIFRIIQSYYNFTADNNIDDQIGLYFVWEQDPSILGYRDGVHEQNEYTEIYFGQFMGLMFNYPGLRYGVIFWELEEANNYLNIYKLENYSLEYIIINKDNIYNIFGRL